MPQPATRPAPGPLAVLGRLIDRLSAAMLVLAGLAMGLMVATVAIDVLGRSLLSRPLPGALEVTTYWWMPMLTLLALGQAEKMGEHIRVTLLLDRLPDRLCAGVEAAVCLLAAGLVLLVAWYTWDEALRGAAIGRTTASRPPVPIWPFVFVAVAGLGVLALQLLASALRHAARARA
jgi:TRAP-type C4-dicarboxylate transport system permease small subunit